MPSDSGNPTRRAVLKATTRTSCGLVGTVAGSGVISANHRTSNCHAEPGLQGQIPLENQKPGRTEGYCRNIDVVGHNSIGDRGANLDMVWYGDYAYVSLAIDQFQANIDPTIDKTYYGTAVIDASDPTNPTVTDVLKSHIHEKAFEGLGVSESNDLLVALHHHSGVIAIHDLTDPAHPAHVSTTNLGISNVVIPAFSPDEEIIYMSHHNKSRKTGDDPRTTEEEPGIAAVDISDPSDPNIIVTHPKTGHAQSISHDGTRLYLADNGVKVFDCSEIQHREDNPEFKRMGEYNTSDLAQRGPTFTRNGREYFITQDEADGDGKRPRPGQDGIFGGGCPWGIVRVYDVTDGSNPRKVSEYKLEVNKYINCPFTQKDGTLTPGVRAVLTFYSPHFCQLDAFDDPNAAFFSWSASGLRVADFRETENPTEIAYFNPPPNPNTEFRKHSIWGKTDQFLDAVPSRIRYRPASGHIWFASVNGGFHIVELTGKASDIPK